jgi:hypothetical protein
LVDRDTKVRHPEFLVLKYWLAAVVHQYAVVGAVYTSPPHLLRLVCLPVGAAPIQSSRAAQSSAARCFQKRAESGDSLPAAANITGQAAGELDHATIGACRPRCRHTLSPTCCHTCCPPVAHLLTTHLLTTLTSAGRHGSFDHNWSLIGPSAVFCQQLNFDGKGVFAATSNE